MPIGTDREMIDALKRQDTRARAARVAVESIHDIAPQLAGLTIASAEVIEPDSLKITFTSGGTLYVDDPSSYLTAAEGF